MPYRVRHDDISIKGANMLEIKNLHATTGGKEILKGLNLSIGAGEVHAIMGPNGAGKSTLSNIIAGKPGYEVTAGEVIYNGENILELEPHERAQAGVFLAFQYPVEIPGVNAAQFLRETLNAVREARGEEPLSGGDFLKLVRGKKDDLKMDQAFLKRSVNAGFSGGEKKRFEILQMSLLEPQLCVMDETDSGLDIDALKVVADGVNALRAANRSFLMITHYQRLLDHIAPDFVHILADGQIAKTGGPELALELEAQGYTNVAGAA